MGGRGRAGGADGCGGLREDGQLCSHQARGPTRPQLFPRQRLIGPRNWSSLCVCVNLLMLCGHKSVYTVTS